MEVILIIGLGAVAVVCRCACGLFERLSSAGSGRLPRPRVEVAATPQVSAATDNNIKPAPKRKMKSIADLIKRQQERVMKRLPPRLRRPYPPCRDDAEAAEDEEKIGSL